MTTRSGNLRYRGMLETACGGRGARVSGGGESMGIVGSDILLIVGVLLLISVLDWSSGRTVR